MGIGCALLWGLGTQLGFRVQGCRVLGFWGLGFRGLGSRGTGLDTWTAATPQTQSICCLGPWELLGLAL